MITQSPTYWVKIYMSGPVYVAEQVCREFCMDVGLCITIETTKFIYTGGEETGFVVGLINYPRFPAMQSDIFETAAKLARRLLDALHQHSVLIMDKDKSVWISKREET